jgi:tRNA(Ile)-lysidine synthase
LREARYAALLALARRTCATAVLTAHTAEDQAETVLLALFRGTGPQGLGGMPPRRLLGEGVELVRPLLRAARAQVRGELHRAALPYALDPGNTDPRYRRTAVRAALAALRTEFPRPDEAVARCAELVRDEAEQNERATARRALRSVLDERGLLRDVPFERIEAALDVRGPGRRVFLKRGVEIVTERP